MCVYLGYAVPFFTLVPLFGYGCAVYTYSSLVAESGLSHTLSCVVNTSPCDPIELTSFFGPHCSFSCFENGEWEQLDHAGNPRGRFNEALPRSILHRDICCNRTQDSAEKGEAGSKAAFCHRDHVLRSAQKKTRNPHKVRMPQSALLN